MYALAPVLTHADRGAQPPYAAIHAHERVHRGVHPCRIEGGKEVHHAARPGERQKPVSRGGMKGEREAQLGERELRAAVGFRIVYQCA